MKTAPSQAVGYEPEKLDAVIQRHLAVAETSIRHAEALGSRVEEALRNLEGHKLLGTAAPVGSSPDVAANALGLALDEASAMTVLFDRQAKAVLNLIKATDELSRLRSFVAGGADSRPDLGELSDADIARVVLDAASKIQRAEA